MTSHRSSRKSGWSLALIILLMVGAGWLLAVQREKMRTITYIIPPNVGVGGNTVDFPAEITLTVGLRDTIVIQNRDDRLHLFGPFVVGPQAVLTKRFTRPQVVQGECTFHPSQKMRLVVKPAPWQGWFD